jgi:hypothetical protein
MGIGGGQFWSVAPEAAVLFGLNPLTKFSHHPRQTTTTTHHTRYTKSSRSHTPSRSDQLTKHHEIQIRALRIYTRLQDGRDSYLQARPGR